MRVLNDRRVTTAQSAAHVDAASVNNDGGCQCTVKLLCDSSSTRVHHKVVTKHYPKTIISFTEGNTASISAQKRIGYRLSL